MNTLYFHSPSGYDSLSAVVLAEALDAWWLLNIAAFLSSSYTFNGVTVKGLANINDIEVTSTSSGVAGGNTSPPLPGNAAWCIKFLSGLTGRSARGRNYIGGLTESMVAGNYMDGAVAANLIDGYNELFTAIAATSFSWVIVSRVTEGVQRPTGVVFSVASVDYTDLAVDSMRRRLAGRGA